MRRTVVAALAALLVSSAAFVCAAPEQAAPAPTTNAANAPLDMETIMANPDWVGHAVEEPYWSVDGRHLYY
ncbi:MAG: hypothetical protein ABI128_14670, partial [Rhodanobacter sp.]